MATTSPPPHRTLPDASRQPREGLTRYAHGDAALMRRSYQAKDWQPTGCVRVHRGWVGWDVVQQTAMRPHAASSNSVHERALSLSELFQPTEEMAEQWGRALAQNTRRNSHSMVYFGLILCIAVSRASATRATHTQTGLCGAVQAGGRSDRDVCLTRPDTRSIYLLMNSYCMNREPPATGGTPCRASKPRLSVQHRSGPFWATWRPPAIRRATGSCFCCR